MGAAIEITDAWIEEQLAIIQSVVADPTLWLDAAIAAREGYPLVLKEVLRLRERLAGCPGLCAWSEQEGGYRCQHRMTGTPD